MGRRLWFCDPNKIMDKPLYLILLAGGSGLRMGADRPKQFLKLQDKYILQHSLERFFDAVHSIKAITVLPKDYIEWWKAYSLESSIVCPQIFVQGGLSRFLSVRNALSKIPNNAIVAVHDGVRPFVSLELIRAMYNRMLEGCQALIPVMPVTDTLRSIDPAIPDPDRSKVVAVQTPQFFDAELLKKAYNQAFSTSFTDDASVVAKLGIPIETISGEASNIKITTPSDLKLAEYILFNF